MVAQKKTELAFEAKIKGVKVVPMKESYAGREGGGLELTLLLDPPKQPAKPRKGWTLDQRRPTVPAEAGANEDAKQFAKRQGAAQKDLAEYEREERRYAGEVEKFKRQTDAVRARTLAYAQIVGFSAVLADTKVSVRLSPANTDLLPGFEVALLEEPEQAPEARFGMSQVDDSDEDQSESAAFGGATAYQPDDRCECSDDFFNHAPDGHCEVTRDGRPCGCGRFRLAVPEPVEAAS